MPEGPYISFEFSDEVLKPVRIDNGNEKRRLRMFRENLLEAESREEREDIREKIDRLKDIIATKERPDHRAFSDTC